MTLPPELQSSGSPGGEERRGGEEERREEGEGRGGKAKPRLQGLTLLLEHLVGLGNLHFLGQANRPAVEQLQDLVLHLL